MRIAIDAGHGPETAGKRSPDGTLREFHFNKAVADEVIKQLKKFAGVEILATYDPNTDLSLTYRTNLVKKWNADALVSIHANAFGAGWNDANGIETFVHSMSNTPAVKLANTIQRKLLQATLLRDRGVKAENFHMVREIPEKTAAVLVECGFMTNRKECELLKSDAYRKLCADAIVNAIVEVYNLKPVNGKHQVAIEVNGKFIANGYVENGVTYAPVRAVVESVGAEIAAYDGKTVSIKKREDCQCSKS